MASLEPLLVSGLLSVLLLSQPHDHEIHHERAHEIPLHALDVPDRMSRAH